MLLEKDKVYKRHLIILLNLVCICLWGARGDIISTEIMGTRDINNTQTYIGQELPQIAQDAFSLEPAKYGYWFYKISYETIDINGNVHVASGAFAYPRSDWPNLKNQAYPILSYQHGTVVEKSSVASVNGEWILPVIIAGAGYVYIEPDYLGLGESIGMHPYQIKEPYGTSVVDMIRAVRNFGLYETDQFICNDQLFLAGYSEGGYATMAVHQIIERDYGEEFNIAASFPMAGAYSMSGIMVDLMLAQQPYGEPFYFPYVLFSYLDAYSEIGTPQQYLLSEYLFLSEWFDGYHSSAEINNAMPSIPITIMKPEEIDNFANNQNHPLRIVLRENDLWDWLPESPMYIFHGLGDELVPYANAELAYDQFIQNGAQEVYLEMIPESLGGHSDVAPWALFGAYQVAGEMMLINELGDVNSDGSLNVLDLVGIANIILYNDATIEYSYKFWASDVNMDDNIDIIDIVNLVNTILQS